MAYTKLNLSTGDQFKAEDLGYIENALSEVISSNESKATQGSLDTRVPSGLSLRADTTVGTRIFAGSTMIYGNTGSRNIYTGSIAPAWGTIDGAGNAVSIRRDNNTVRISISGFIPGTDDGVRALFTLPAGYRPASLILSAKITNRDTADPDMELDISPAGVVTARKMPSNSRHYGTLAFTTGDAWPTILP